MEVNRGNFFWMLPHMLQEAETAQYVAIDIEMSGIASGYGHLTPIPEAYAKVKEAAEEYQVLQIGVTFIHYIEKKSEYTTRTFNCYVSPLFPKGHFNDALNRHLDRNFSVSTRSYTFLRHHGFNFIQALDNGVYYLSRKEQKLAEEFCSWKDPEHEHIDPSTLDDETQQFYDDVRAQVGAYVNGRNGVHPEVVIQNPYGKKLNGLQIRLIHQIVREEYPTCTAKRIPVGKMMGNISVTLLTRSTKIEAESRRQLNVGETKRLSGMQILLEALAGGSFADRIEQDWVYHSNGVVPAGADSWNEFNKKFNFRRCEANLKKNRPIIIGHNIFQDLAFIYHAFFEPLPAKVDDFLNTIHQLFPRIADTKFMHSRVIHQMEQDRTLKELSDYFAKHKVPTIRHVSHPGEVVAGPHNAAYDSTLTANLFLRQACYLYNTNKHLMEIQETYYTPEKRSAPSDHHTPGKSATTSKIRNLANPFTILDEEEEEVVGALSKWNVLSPDESQSRASTPMVSTPMASTPMASTPRPSSPTEAPPQTSRRTEQKKKIAAPSRKTRTVPPWSDDFWEVYGNKTLIPGSGFVSLV